MNRLAFRISVALTVLSVSGSAVAIGLGELRGQATLGAAVRLEADILGAGKGALDPGCFKLIAPGADSDLPWLRRARFSVRPATPPVLEIQSEVPLRDPITQLVVQIGCGHEISREYVVFASPTQELPPTSSRSQLAPYPALAPTTSLPRQTQARPPAAPRPRAPRAPQGDPEARSSDAMQVPRPVRRAERKAQSNGLRDRILLSDGVEVGEPSLRLATDLTMLRALSLTEAQREILRLEFRMLNALNEQATSQLATAEKLRSMEGILGELQQRTTDFAQKVQVRPAAGSDGAPQAGQTTAGTLPGQSVSGPSSSPAGTSVSAAVAPGDSGARPPSAQPTTRAATPPAKAETGLSEWSLYGVALGAVLGFVGWIGWNKFRDYKRRKAEFEDDEIEPNLPVDPKRGNEFEEPGGVDLQVEPAAMGMAMKVDVDLDNPDIQPDAKGVPLGHDSMFSIAAATVDEHFEANPVMELADIMLSFGRVKGAAQALQEYIDNNPQEALQPWIRLMEVYRMAGMRDEFENIARNLNQNFNVEIQQWEEALAPTDTQRLDVNLDGAVEASSAVPTAPRPKSLEDMPRIVNTVLELWPSGDVTGYLYQLLRDNREGKRLGFALPVVEEILFLIELKETANRME